METFLSILLVVFFVLVNAFFSGTEMAVISLNDAKMHKLAEEGDRKALRVIKFLDNPTNYRCRNNIKLPVTSNEKIDIFLTEFVIPIY